MRSYSTDKKEQISQLSPITISRQYRSYLLLELLIALFLIGVCAMPVVQLPMKAMREEIKSMYRMQLHRLGDLAFAKFKEQLYHQEIPWKILASSKDEKAKVLEGSKAKLFLGPLDTREFEQVATVYSVGKKNKQGEEWRLVTFQVEFNPISGQSKLLRGKKSSKRSRTFTYQILLLKIPATQHVSPELS